MIRRAILTIKKIASLLFLPYDLNNIAIAKNDPVGLAIIASFIISTWVVILYTNNV
jgi:hypothetical protein